ncbi:MAG: hypothetical protein HGB30_05130 [Holophagaceae bacterium]|nr:hypothetical protein [Holophagaceae bacterium]
MDTSLPENISFHILEERDRFFDDSSIVPRDQRPRLVLLMGAPAVGKTTIRKDRYSKGYVIVDAAEIFLNLSRGGFYSFPTAFEEPMELIGIQVAKRAVFQLRNIVVELIGASFEPLKELLDAMYALGYEIDVQLITCDYEETVRRNANRGRDCISAHYAERFQRAWLVEAAKEALALIEGM